MSLQMAEPHLHILFSQDDHEQESERIEALEARLVRSGMDKAAASLQL